MCQEGPQKRIIIKDDKKWKRAIQYTFHGVHHEYPKDKDPREELFNYAIDSKWIVTEMSPHSVNLESIFRTLTMEGSADA